MRAYRIITIDAFTRVPLTGNPCAVLPDAGGLSDAEMQAVARETNLSETAFVVPFSEPGPPAAEEAGPCFRVRYFTPRGEIPFAGHPTIATAFALAEEGRIALRDPVTRVRFAFNIGVLPVEIHARGGRPAKVVMTQQQPIFGPTFSREETAPCFGLDPVDLLPGPLRGSRAPGAEILPQVVSTGVPFLIVPVRDARLLSRIGMRQDLLAALCARAGVGAVFAFCLGGFSGGADTGARLLDPAGGSEDPFTGSATGCLAAYVVRYGLRPGPRLIAEQGHPLGRPGIAEAEVIGPPHAIEAVRVGGEAVRTLEGRLFLP